MKSLISLFSILCLAIQLNGQIEIDQTVSDVNNFPSLFLGPNFDLSNISYSGDNNQIGLFLGENSNLGLDLGLVLGTGDVNLAGNIGSFGGPGGNLSGASSEGGGNFGAGDVDLELIANAPVNDAVILEFDFVPLVSEISFEYIFASEEYPEFSCGSFNDAFGFFISGPGISGGGLFENDAINLATVPNSDPPVPITINTINSGNSFSGQACFDQNPNWQADSIYYLANDFVFPNEDPQVIEYDGFTVPITANLELEIGQTYHMKLAIGDGADAIYDSAVFIKSSSQVIVSPSVVGYPEDLNGTGLVEGCLNGFFEILLSESIDLDQVSIQLQGTAEMGSDYETVDVSVSQISDGVMNIPINLIIDDEDEGLESVELVITYTDFFGIVQTLQETLTLNDLNNMELGLPSEYPLCGENSVLIDATPAVGLGPFDYQWSNSISNESEILVFSDSELLTVTVIDYCGQSVSHEIELVESDLSLITSQITICAGDSLTVIEEGNPPYTFQISNDLISLNSSNQLIAAEGDYSSSVTVTDQCGFEESIQVNVETCTNIGEIHESRDFDLLVAGSILTLSLSNELEPSEITIYDTSGRVVIAQPWKNSDTCNVDLNNFSTGHYVVHIALEDRGVLSKKFFKP